MPTIFLVVLSGMLDFDWVQDRGDWFLWTALTILVLFETLVLMMQPPSDFEKSRHGYN